MKTAWRFGIVILALGVFSLTGCKRSNSNETPSVPETKNTPESTTEGADEASASTGSESGDGGGEASTPMPELPPGHPPIGDVSDTTSESASETQEEVEAPTDGPVFTAPEAWKPLKPRNAMIREAYALPGQEEDAEDAEDATLEITLFPGMKDIPFAEQIPRWEGAFTILEGQPGSISKKQTAVQGGNFKIQLFDISGTYQQASMFGGNQGAPKENYRMLVAQVDTDHGPAFVKLLGSNETVTHWESDYLTFLKTAR